MLTYFRYLEFTNLHKCSVILTILKQLEILQVLKSHYAGLLYVALEF